MAPEVLRDWKISSKRPGSKSSAETKGELYAKLEEFFAGEEAKVDLSKVESESMVANQMVVKAIDHALRGGAGRALIGFKPSRRLEPLRPGEERYFLDIAALPQSCAREGACQRACVRDKATGSTRLELPSELIGEASLHVRSDQGAIGWPAYIYMFSSIGLNGTYAYDTAHHAHNELENGIKSSKCWWLMLEMTIVLNLVMGPWNGSSWFSTLRGALDTYVANHTWRCPLFAFFYERIAKDFQDCPAGAYGSAEHMEATFARLKTAKVFFAKGVRVKMARWMSIWDSWDEFKMFSGVFTLVLAYACLRHGIVKNRQDLQKIANSTAAPATARGPTSSRATGSGASASVAPAPSAPPRQEVRHSNKDVASLREKAANTLHLALLIQANTTKYSMMQAMSFIVAPVRRRFGQMIVMQKTQKGCVDFWVDAARGDGTTVLFNKLR